MTEPVRNPSPAPTARDEPAAGAVTGSLHDPSATRDFPEASADRATGEAAGRLPAIDGYDVLNVLGRGGMGVVYRARHIRLNRVVALKVILSGSHAAEYELARFQTEAETIARLSHPHIVQVYEVGQAEGRPYLALEFVDGGSLDHRLTGAPQPAAVAARFVEALAQAVHYAHSQGIIHRDLKPANILLSFSREIPASADKALAGVSRLNDAVPKITDFGLAKKVDSTGPTVSGAVMGTPSYMAPEQAGGRVRDIGTATDVYALGAILYELLTGRPPFLGATQADTLLQVVGDEPVPPRRLLPGVPRDLDTICLKCLHKQPANRYASAGDLADDLRRFLAGEPIRARAVGVLERFGRWCRRNPVVAGLAAAVAFCLVAATVIATVMAFRIDAARTVADNNAAEARKAQVEASDNAASADKARADAVHALEGEKQAHRDADRERTRAEAGLYFSSINLAGRYWLTNQVEQAERNLDDCPPELRAWEWRLLKRLCHAELRSVAAPETQTTLPVAFSPDATAAASICVTTSAGNSLSDWTVKVWNTADGSDRFVIDTALHAIRAVAFSPDGKRVALVRGDNFVQICQKTETGTGAKQVHIFGAGPARCLGVTFSRNGRFVASCHADGTAQVYELLPNGSAPMRIRVEGHTHEVNDVAFSPDGQFLATAGADETVQIAKIVVEDSGAKAPPPVRVIRLARVLRGHRGAVTSVRFSPDGKRLASTSRDGTVKLWNVHDGTEFFTLRGFTGVVNRVEFSPDGRRLATAGSDRTVRLWDVETGQELFALRGHGGAVLAVAYRPDGQQILSVGEDKTLKVWDAATGRQGLRFSGHSAALAFSPDGRRLALPAAGQAGAVTVWDMASGREALGPQLPVLAATVLGGSFGSALPLSVPPPLLTGATLTLRGHGGPIMRLAFSADGHRLASVSLVETRGQVPVCEVIVWDLANGGVVFRKREPTADVPALTFSGDGRLLVLLTEGNQLRTWDMTSGVSRTFPAGASGLSIVHGVACSADGSRVALAGVGPLERFGLTNYVVHVLDCQSGTLLAVCHGHEEAVEAMCFGKGRDDHDDLLATAGADRTVLIWDMSAPAFNAQDYRTGRRTPIVTLRGHTQTVRAMSFSPDGKRLATVSWEGKQTLGEVKVWDLPAGREVLTLDYPGVDIAFSGDGARLAVTGPDGAVRVWDGTPRREILTLRDAGQTLALHGRQIATAGDEGGIKLWDTRLGREVRRLKGLDEGNPNGHRSAVRRLTFSGDGKLLASAGDDQTVKVWDPATGTLKRTFIGHKDPVLDVAFSPDASRLASAGADETVRVHDLATDRVVVLKGHTDRVLCVAFSPDGKRIASGGDDKWVFVWDAQDGRELFRLGPHADAVNRVAFSPDGSLLASAGEDRIVKIWDVEARKLVRTLEGHADGVRDVAFSADGRYLATASWDGQVKVWDVATGKEAFSPLVHERGVRAVAFGPGETLTTIAADGTVRVWQMKP